MEQEGRQNLVRDRARQIWEREGKRDGDHERHWSQAEQEIREEQLGKEEAGDTGIQTGHKASGANGIASSLQPGGMSPGGGPAAGADSMARRIRVAKASPARTERLFYTRADRYE